jgi:hypothetical protein
MYVDNSGNSIVATAFILTAPFSATGQRIYFDSYSNSAYVNMEIKNNAGEVLNIKGIDFNVKSPVGASCNLNVEQTLVSGETGLFAAECSGIKTGDSFNSEVKIRYIRTGASMEQISVGTLSGKVE